MKTNLISKISPVTNFFRKQKLVSSLILCLVVFMIYFAISGFNIISGNDDYCIFKLIYFGDIGIGCVGFFFTWFISVIQPLFGNLNSYMIFQELICLSSMLVINYIFLSKLSGKTALLLAVVFDIIYFSFIPFNIMFTYTSVSGCSAGMALLIYASMFESRKRFRIIQEISSILLVFAGSQVRFPPFQALGAVTFVFALGVLLASFIKNKKGNSFKTAVFNVIKKYLKTGIILIVTAMFIFGANYASDALKHTVKGADELIEYNTALSEINDYDNTTYFVDKDFYKSIGIKSLSDYTVMRHWFIDEDFLTLDKLEQIAANSQKNNTLSNKKGVIESILNPLAEAFTGSCENGSIILVGFLIFVFIFGVIIFCVFLPDSRAAVLRFGSFVALWLFFFVAAQGIKTENILAIPMAALTIYISFRYDNYVYLKTLAVTLIVFVLYFYMITFRIYLHVTLAFFFPAFIYIVMAIENDVPKKTPRKSKRSVVPICITASVLIICSVISSVLLFNDQVVARASDQNARLRQYIVEHPDKKFLINQVCLAKDYYDPFVMSEEPKNLMNFGLWVGKSGYMKNARERNGIKHVFKDSINNNVLIPLFEPKEENGILVTRFSEELSDYYNNHYAKKGETISLECVERVGEYSLYSIVSKKDSKK